MWNAYALTFMSNITYQTLLFVHFFIYVYTKIFFFARIQFIIKLYSGFLCAHVFNDFLLLNASDCNAMCIRFCVIFQCIMHFSYEHTKKNLHFTIDSKFLVRLQHYMAVRVLEFLINEKSKLINFYLQSNQSTVDWSIQSCFNWVFFSFISEHTLD